MPPSGRQMASFTASVTVLLWSIAILYLFYAEMGFFRLIWSWVRGAGA